MRHRCILFVMLAAGSGACTDRSIAHDDEIDVERICSDYCELRERCSPGAPDYVMSCPGSGVFPTCYDDCVMSGGAGKRKDLGRNWTDACRFERADYYDCVVSSTCEEWYQNDGCSGTPVEDRRCGEEDLAYGVCRGSH
jgi:hypothetical protein